MKETSLVSLCFVVTGIILSLVIAWILVDPVFLLKERSFWSIYTLAPVVAPLLFLFMVSRFSFFQDNVLFALILCIIFVIVIVFSTMGIKYRILNENIFVNSYGKIVQPKLLHVSGKYKKTYPIPSAEYPWEYSATIDLILQNRVFVQKEIQYTYWVIPGKEAEYLEMIVRHGNDTDLVKKIIQYQFPQGRIGCFLSGKLPDVVDACISTFLVEAEPDYPFLDVKYEVLE